MPAPSSTGMTATSTLSTRPASSNDWKSTPPPNSQMSRPDFDCFNAVTNVPRIVVDDANAASCGRRKSSREHDEVEPGNADIGALGGLVRFAAHHRRIEFAVQGAEVDRWIHDDPVVLAVGPGDESIQAHRHLVAEASAHAVIL